MQICPAAGHAGPVREFVSLAYIIDLVLNRLLPLSSNHPFEFNRV
jgi:hypothetical protein